MFDSWLKICQKERYQRYEQNKAYTIQITWSEGEGPRNQSLMIIESSFCGSLDDKKSITIIYRQIRISACKRNTSRRVIKWTSVLDMRIPGYSGARILPSVFGSRLKLCQQERYQRYEQNEAYTIHITWSEGNLRKEQEINLAWSLTSQFLPRVPLRVRRDVCS